MTILAHVVSLFVAFLKGFNKLAKYLAEGEKVLSPMSQRDWEDKSVAKVKVLDDKILRKAESGPSFSPISVDGSTRMLSAPHFTAYIVGVAVYGLKDGGVLQFIPGSLGTKFVAVRATRETLKKIEGDDELNFVVVKDSTGKYFDENYNGTDGDLLDELRVSMENKALMQIAEKDAGRLIVVDGPVYLDHWAKTRLAQMRLGTLEKLRERDFTVVGVVKRVKSRKLCTPEVLDALSLNVDERHCNDLYVISRLAPREGIYVVGPFEAVYGEKQANNKGRNLMYYIYRDYMPDKVFWYISAYGSIYRVEVLKQDYRDEVEEIVRYLAYHTTKRGVPYDIDVADSCARRYSASLLVMLRAAVKSYGVPLTYESEEAYRLALRDVARGA